MIPKWPKMIAIMTALSVGVASTGLATPIDGATGSNPTPTSPVGEVVGMDMPMRSSEQEPPARRNSLHSSPLSSAEEGRTNQESVEDKIQETLVKIASLEDLGEKARSIQELARLVSDYALFQPSDKNNSVSHVFTDEVTGNRVIGIRLHAEDRGLRHINLYDVETNLVKKKWNYQRDGVALSAVTTYRAFDATKNEVQLYHKDGVTLKAHYFYHDDGKTKSEASRYRRDGSLYSKIFKRQDGTVTLDIRYGSDGQVPASIKMLDEVGNLSTALDHRTIKTRSTSSEEQLLITTEIDFDLQLTVHRESIGNSATPTNEDFIIDIKTGAIIWKQSGNVIEQLQTYDFEYTERLSSALAILELAQSVDRWSGFPKAFTERVDVIQFLIEHAPVPGPRYEDQSRAHVVALDRDGVSVLRRFPGKIVRNIELNFETEELTITETIEGDVVGEPVSIRKNELPLYWHDVMQDLIIGFEHVQGDQTDLRVMNQMLEVNKRFLAIATRDVHLSGNLRAALSLRKGGAALSYRDGDAIHTYNINAATDVVRYHRQISGDVFEAIYTKETAPLDWINSFYASGSIVALVQSNQNPPVADEIRQIRNEISEHLGVQSSSFVYTDGAGSFNAGPIVTHSLFHNSIIRVTRSSTYKTPKLVYGINLKSKMIQVTNSDHLQEGTKAFSFENPDQTSDYLKNYDQMMFYTLSSFASLSLTNPRYKASREPLAKYLKLLLNNRPDPKRHIFKDPHAQQSARIHLGPADRVDGITLTDDTTGDPYQVVTFYSDGKTPERIKRYTKNLFSANPAYYPNVIYDYRADDGSLESSIGLSYSRNFGLLRTSKTSYRRDNTKHISSSYSSQDGKTLVKRAVYDAKGRFAKRITHYVYTPTEHFEISSSTQSYSIVETTLSTGAQTWYRFNKSTKVVKSHVAVNGHEREISLRPSDGRSYRLEVERMIAKLAQSRSQFSSVYYLSYEIRKIESAIRNSLN